MMAAAGGHVALGVALGTRRLRPYRPKSASDGHGAAWNDLFHVSCVREE